MVSSRGNAKDDGTMSTDTDEDLTLRAWGGDDSVKGEILRAHGMSLEKSIARLLPTRFKGQAEDVVCQAIANFWASRNKYDGKRPLGAYLYTIAKNIASDLASGKRPQQKSQNMERYGDHGYLDSFEHPVEAELDQVEEENSDFIVAVRESLGLLSDIERDVIEAYGLSDNHEDVNAVQLGIELGEKYKDGVPIPKGTIRQHKFRGKEKLAKAMRQRGYDIENPGGKR